ncbi:MAG: hypothetical protein AAGB12_01585 [Pseudomonadota bacterium]
MIDRVSRIERMMQVVRAQRHQKHTTPSPTLPPLHSTSDHLQIDSPTSLQTQLKAYCKDLDLQDKIAMKSARAYVLKAVLVHQLGEAIENEPEFAGICDRMIIKIENNEELKTYYNGLIQSILSL